MAMNVLLINPRNPSHENYVVIPNVGLGFIASLLIKNGFKVEIVDCIKENYSYKDFENLVKSSFYDVYGINFFTPSFSSIKNYVEIIRKHRKDATIILGGPHPTFEPLETMELFKNVDFAFRGEGEIGMQNLLALISNNEQNKKEKLEKIQNLVWRDGSKIICNKKEVINDLSKIEIPAWDLLKPHTYPLAPNGIFSKQSKIVPIYATRGCPYKCTFCGAGISMGHKIRKRPITQLIDEIKLIINKFKIYEFHIMDDNFTQDPTYVEMFCDQLLNQNMKIFWACPNGIRINTLNKNLLQQMEKSGCYSFALGIESGSQEILDSLKKKISIEEIIEKTKMIKKYSNIESTGFFIIGLPQENISDIKKTINFSTILNIDKANFFNFSPFPGSEIYYDLKKTGRLKNIKFDNLYIHNIVFTSPNISKSELRKLQITAHIMFYLRLRILLRIIKEIKSVFQIKIIFLRALKIIKGG